MTETTEATATTTASGAESVQSQAAAETVVAGTETQATTTATTEQAADQSATKPQGAPEKYEFKYPEGYQVDETALGEYSASFKELGLTNEQAQKLVDMDAKRSAGSAGAAAEAQAKQVEAWVGELKQDKDFGGGNFEANVKVAQKAMTDFGTPELRQMLDASGLGSHPEVVRFFHRVGKGLGEGSIHKTTSEQPAERSLANRMYPDYPA